MSLTRRWSLLTAVLILGILAASWFLLVSPKRADATDLRNQATKQQSNNAALAQQLNELKAQSLDLPKQKAELAVLAKEIPDNPALPNLIRDLTAAGKKVGVQVASMKPGSPTAVAVAVPVAPVAAVPATGDTSTPPATGTTTGTAPAAAATPAAAEPAAAPLFVLPLSLQITGSYFEVEQFINKLEGMQRKFLLTGFSIKPQGSDSTGTAATGSTNDLSLSLTGQVFLSPIVAAAATTPVAAPATAAAQ
jgi:Tfp pilus assembly protein PilO